MSCDAAFFVLATPHRVATIVAQVAIPISHRDRSAVVARRRVGLETGELLATSGDAAVLSHDRTGPLQQRWAKAVAVRVMLFRVSVRLGRRSSGKRSGRSGGLLFRIRLPTFRFRASTFHFPLSAFRRSAT